MVIKKHVNFNVQKIMNSKIPLQAQPLIYFYNEPPNILQQSNNNFTIQPQSNLSPIPNYPLKNDELTIVKDRFPLSSNIQSPQVPPPPQSYIPSTNPIYQQANYVQIYPYQSPKVQYNGQTQLPPYPNHNYPNNNLSNSFIPLENMPKQDNPETDRNKIIQYTASPTVNKQTPNKNTKSPTAKINSQFKQHQTNYPKEESKSNNDTYISHNFFHPNDSPKHRSSKKENQSKKSAASSEHEDNEYNSSNSHSRRNSRQIESQDSYEEASVYEESEVDTEIATDPVEQDPLIGIISSLDYAYDDNENDLWRITRKTPSDLVDLEFKRTQPKKKTAKQ